MIKTNSWSKHFSIKTSSVVSKLMIYASIASPIYGSWGIDTDSYYENYLMLTSNRSSKEDKE